MVDSRPAILVAEDQIFIALEAERILSEGFDCTVEICRRDKLGDALAEKQFDVIILEFSGIESEDSHYASLARAAGALLLFLTASNDLADLGGSFPDVPRIRKPFNETEVRTFIEMLLMGVQPG